MGSGALGLVWPIATVIGVAASNTPDQHNRTLIASRMFARPVWMGYLRSGTVLGRTFSTGKVRMSDPYKMLDATRNEDFASIKKKYYKMVNVYHPDKNPSEVNRPHYSGSQRHFPPGAGRLRRNQVREGTHTKATVVQEGWDRV